MSGRSRPGHETKRPFDCRAIITFALRTRPNALQTAEIQRTWQRPRHNEAALGLDGDAHDLMRMDTDKG